MTTPTSDPRSQALDSVALCHGPLDIRGTVWLQGPGWSNAPATLLDFIEADPTITRVAVERTLDGRIGSYIVTVKR
jgi:hypothetical protein